LHQVIRNETMLEKIYGDMMGYRYLTKLAAGFLCSYIEAETSTPQFYT